MLHFRIAAFRGRDPDNPSDRKHPSNGRFCQRMEINVGGTTNTLPSVGKETSQERMLDIIREHETLTRTYPARWFVSNTMPIEYKVISSSRSKEVMTEGEDNDVDLFGKKE